MPLYVYDRCHYTYMIDATIRIWSMPLYVYDRCHYTYMIYATVHIWSMPMYVYGRYQWTYMTDATVRIWPIPMNVYDRCHWTYMIDVTIRIWLYLYKYHTFVSEYNSFESSVWKFGKGACYRVYFLVLKSFNEEEYLIHMIIY